MNEIPNKYESVSPTCIFVSRRHQGFPLWMIAEEIADATQRPYEQCLKFAKKAEELPRGLPLPQNLRDYIERRLKGGKKRRQ